jgi:hypothetical protein
VNWSELNRRLDERLEPEDAMLVAKRFGLDLDQFPAKPTLREMVQAGDMSLGDVARILDPNSELDQEPQIVYEDLEVYPAEYLKAEERLDRELSERGRIVPITREPTVYAAQKPEVVDEFDRPITEDGGVTAEESDWLMLKFGLAERPVVGTALGQIVEDNELDPDIVANSLELMAANSPAPPQDPPRERRLVDLDNPADVKAVYNSVRNEFIWRQLKVIAISTGVVLVLAFIISAANSCQGPSNTLPTQFPTEAPR